MKILVISHNSSLRSTTCLIEAALSKAEDFNNTFEFVFSEKGPWQKQLANEKVKCTVKSFKPIQKESPLSALFELLKWYKIIINSSPDIIHCNEHDNYPMIKHICGLLRIPVVVGVHFVIRNGFSKWAFGGKYRPSKLLYTSQYQLSNSLSYLPSNFAEEDLCMIGFGRDFKKMRLPYEKKVVRPPEYEGKIVIGTASSIRPRKRIEDFVKVIDFLVHEEKREVVGLIAGGLPYADVGYLSGIEELISSLNLKEHCLMVGNLEDMTEFYSTLDIFISTSELESFGMSVCEAMSFGVATIGYEGGSVREVINDEKCIAQNLNLKQLKNMALALCDDECLREKISSTQEKRVMEQFSPEPLAERLQKIYKMIIKHE